MPDREGGVDRRLFVAGASALTLAGAARAASAESGGKVEAGAAAAAREAAARASGRRLRQVLGDFVARFDVKTVPPDVIELARVGFIDTIGVGVAGSHEDVSNIVAEMVRLEGSSPQAAIIGQSVRASPQLAALANGVACHAMDYDFTFISGQAAAPVIPALLSLAESVKATPQEVIGAFIVGCEVAARIGRASPQMTNNGGWHPTGIMGAVATAAACAKLLKLDAAKAAQAIGVSTSLASGLAVNYGTMTKPLHCGNAARNGLMAALLAAQGFTSHAAAMEGNNAFFTSFGRGLKNDYAPFDDLGKRWDLSEVGYSLKFYPCGGRGHTAIEAALHLRDKVAGRLDDITNIHCLMSPSSAKRVNTEYPTTVEAAKFSAAYVLAYALVHGAPKIKAFTDEALKDARVRAIAGHVTAAPDPSLDAGLIENPTHVKITLKDGQSIEHRREFATGSKQVPMTAAQVEEKFMDCATQAVSAETAKKLFAVVSTITESKSFDEFWPLIRKA